MSGLARAFSYLIALQFQALGMIYAAWWGGRWLNEHHPIAVNWMVPTFAVTVVAIAHTFYLVIRHLWKQEQERTRKAEGGGGGGASS